MPRSDWLLVVTLFGCLGFAALGLYDAESRYQPPNDYRADACRDGGTTALPFLTPAKDATGHAGAHGRDIRGDHTEISCESISAQAAVIQAKAARAGTLTGYSQTLLTFLALGAAIAAAAYAKGAAEQARRGADEAARSADAAIQSLSHARDISQRQLRAYVVIRTVLVGPFSPGSHTTVTLHIVNTGQTPARALWIDWRWKICQPDDSEIASTNLSAKQSSGSRGSLGASEAKDLVYIAETGEPYIQSVISRQANFFIYGAIHYKDIFDDWWVTPFRYINGDPPHRLYMCYDGNEAT